MKASVQDKLPPNDSQSERGIIGCAIQDGRLAPELRLDWFYDLRYRQVAETVLGMATASQPIDMATVFQAMSASGTTDASQLITECVKAAPSPANFSYWRDILVEKLV